MSAAVAQPTQQLSLPLERMYRHVLEESHLRINCSSASFRKHFGRSTLIWNHVGEYCITLSHSHHIDLSTLQSAFYAAIQSVYDTLFPPYTLLMLRVK